MKNAPLNFRRQNIHTHTCVGNISHTLERQLIQTNLFLIALLFIAQKYQPTVKLNFLTPISIF